MPDLTSQEKTEALEKLETSLIILADTLTVPYVRVACLNQGSLEIIGTNPSQKNIPLSEGLLPSNNLFCKHVIQTGKFLKVSNAPKNIKWKNSTEVRKGITSYFGMPLFSQDGKVLGTFCIFDSKENDFSNDPLILQFKTLIEMHLVPLLKALETEENKQLDLVSLNRALENKRRKLSTLISNLPGIVYRCANDPNWTMEYINGDCFNLTGYHQGDIENNRKLSFADLIHPDDQGQVWEKVQKAIKNKSPFKLIYKIICKDGTEKWLWEQGRGVFSKEGNLIALEGFITDITEQKKNEMKLEKYRHHLESRVKERTTELEISTAQLKRSNEALNEFASIASHDLKEPLRKIVTFSLHIQSHSDQMDEKCNNYFDRIIKASERMGQFIDDLLEYSQVSSKSRPFHIVDLKSIIQDALIDLESRIHKTKAIIHISDIPPLEADGMQMKQLFQNLLSNEFKSLYVKLPWILVLIFLGLFNLILVNSLKFLV